MQAVNGYIENGRFISDKLKKFPKRIQAVLVFDEKEFDGFKPETKNAKAWREFFEAVNSSDEKIPENFEKLNFGREVRI